MGRTAHQIPWFWLCSSLSFKWWGLRTRNENKSSFQLFSDCWLEVRVSHRVLHHKHRESSWAWGNCFEEEKNPRNKKDKVTWLLSALRFAVVLWDKADDKIHCSRVSMEQIPNSAHYSPSWGDNIIKSVLGDLSSSAEHRTDTLRLAVVIISSFSTCYNPFEDKVSWKRSHIKRTD